MKKGGGKYHSLLNEQVQKFLSEESLANPEIRNLLSEIDKTYNKLSKPTDPEEKDLSEISGIQELGKALLILEKKYEIGNEADVKGVKLVDNFIEDQVQKRKKLEQDLEKSAQVLSTLVSNLSSAVLMEDEKRSMRYVNQTFCEMFGIPAPPEALIGMDCSNAAQDSKVMFKDPEGFVSRIDFILKEQKLVMADKLELVDGRFLERNYIPIFIDGVYGGHLWNYVDITDQKINERKLRESQDELRRLSLVASANPNGVLLTDADGKIFWSNEGYKNLTGYSASELLGKIPLEIAQGELSDEKLLNAMIDDYANGRSFSVEVAYYRKDKSWFWARVKGEPVREENGVVQHYFSIIEDVTNEKNREEQIKRLSVVASANSKGVFILNDDISFAWINGAYEKMTGYSLSDLVGKNPMSLFLKNIPNESLVKRLTESDKRGQAITEEFLHDRKDGSSFWARLNVQYLINEQGQIIQRFGVLEDITKEKDAETTLRINEEKYRNIIANINLGLLEVDNDDVIQYANQSFVVMSGYELDELVGSPASELFTLKTNDPIVSEKRLLRRKGKSDAYEIAVKNKKGELKYWLISGAPRLNDVGEVIGSIGIHLDITKQKLQEMELIEARQRAEDSSRAKEAFLANMSHEIRTPLNAIIGMLRELSKESVSEKQKYFLSNADTASRHLLSIINNILDMSKIEAGEFRLESRHFSLLEVIDETISIVSSGAESKGLDLQMKVTDQLKPAFVGDPSRIRQILLNILGNAIKFTEKGSVRLDCTTTNTTRWKQLVILTITDTGIGMDKSFFINLFKKFSQEEKSNVQKFGGTGLGMAISSELVQMMGGEIDVKSKKGEGTKVTLQIPLQIGDPEQVENVSDPQNYDELKGLKVLLVEDNEMNRVVAMNSLTYFNFEVEEAENGFEAIEILQHKSFDIVLMDIRMPGMDGIEATRIIRQELKITTPIIALTANAFKKEVERCIESGMNDYVTKPFEEKALAQTILRNIRKEHMNISDSSAAEDVGTISPMQPVAGELLYDLSKLNTASRGNPEFVQKMIRLFVSQASETMTEMKTAFVGKEFSKVSDLAHRLKPAIDNLGVEVLKEQIRAIEKTALENPADPKLERIILSSDEIVAKVVDQMKRELV